MNTGNSPNLAVSLEQLPQVARSADSAPTPVRVISPDDGWFNWRLRELWRYRDLVLLFVWRDFVSVYKQTILGPAWHLFRPLLTTVVFTIVFGRMARLSTDGVPAFLFYMTGFVLWSYFATSFENVSKSFVSNSNLLGKVYFHRLAIPLSIVLSNVISFAIQLLLVAAVWIFFVFGGASVHLTWRWLFIAPVIVMIVAGYAFALGIIVCAVTTRYRDLTHLITFGTQLAMYITPVIYPLSSLSPGYQMLVRLNPLTPLFEGFRLALLGVGDVGATDVLISGAIVVTLLVVGLTMFTRAARTFMDTV